MFFAKKKEKKDKIFAKKRKKRILHRKFANFLSISGLIFPFKLSKLNKNCEAVERGRGRSHPQQKNPNSSPQAKFFEISALEGLRRTYNRPFSEKNPERKNLHHVKS